LYNVERAFRAGWGGVVWKTLGIDPPIVNVSSRYGAVHYNGGVYPQCFPNNSSPSSTECAFNVIQLICGRGRSQPKWIWGFDACHVAT
jgi:hypothetical protein